MLRHVVIKFGDYIVKKIYAVLIALFVFISTVFSGCSLIQQNNLRYMNQIVASVNGENTTIEITMEKYLLFFSSYYSTYVNDYGYTPEAAAEAIMGMLIGRELLLGDIKFDGAGDEIPLTIKETNDVWEKVFGYVRSSLTAYITEVKTDWKIKDPETTGSTESTEQPKVYPTKTDFVRAYEYVAGVVTKIPAVQDTTNYTPTVNYYESFFWKESEKADPLFTYTGAVKNKIVSYSDGVTEEALKRYVNILKKNEEYKKLTNNTPWEIFERELNRMFEIEKDNAYLNKMETLFNEQTTIQNSQLLEYAKYQFASQKELYSNSLNNYNAYNTAMKSDSTKVFYHPTAGWFNVSHVLIGYSDLQTADKTKWDTQLSKGIITKAEYDANMNTLKTQVRGQARDDKGNLFGPKYSALSILSEIESAVEVAGNNVTERAKVFDSFVYKYSTDEGFLNRDFDYAIPLDSTYDTMIKEFADESRALYNKGLGSMSKLVWGTYGAHIIMFTSVNSNVIGDANTLTLQQLWNSPIKATSNKTWFDLMVAGVQAKDFNVYRTTYIDQLKTGLEIKYFKSRYEHLYK